MKTSSLLALANCEIQRSTGRMIAGGLDENGALRMAAEIKRIGPGEIFDTTAEELAYLRDAGAAVRIPAGGEEAALAAWRARQGHGVSQVIAEGEGDE